MQKLSYVILFIVLGISMCFGQQSSNTTLLGRWPNGPCYASFVVGNIAYIGNGGALQIMDISNPAMSVSLGQVATPSVVKGIFVSGGMPMCRMIRMVYISFAIIC